MKSADSQAPSVLFKRPSPLVPVFAAIIGCGILYWVIDNSPTFQECIHKHKSDAAYHKLYEDSPVASRTARLRLQTVCIEDWTDRYQGALGAIATIMVAAFTFTLWRSTERLWKSAEVQRSADEAARREEGRRVAESLRIAAEAAAAAKRSADTAETALSEYERPWIFRDIVSIVWRHTPGAVFNDWWVSIKWKNVGRSPALIQAFEYKFSPHEGLAPRPDYTDCHRFGVVPTLAPGMDFETQQVGIGGSPNTGVAPIEYVLFGRLTYAEMNGREHISGFALRLAPIGCAALECGGDAYNYYT